MGSKKITMETIETYVRLDNEIHMMEMKNIRKNLQMKEDQLRDVQLTQSQLEKHFKECQERTKKEKADVDNLQAEIKSAVNKSSFNEKMSKEEAEYLEALNKEEIAKKDVEGIAKQIEDIQKEIKAMQPDVEKLDKLTAEQEELLSGIFKGNYGSQRENELESQLDMLQEKKQRIGVARYKWTNGRILLQHAVKQMCDGVQKWGELSSLSDNQAKYTAATEARNNFVAASSNLKNTQKYINNIDFPYCKPKEIDTLDKATANVYIDMMSADRLKHAMECYSVTYKRSAALLQWFDNVLNTVIEKDFKTASDEEKECSKNLRMERLKLMKEEVEKDGGSVNLDASEQQFKDDQEQELANLTEGNDQGPDGSERPGPTPLPLKDLAPCPSNEMLFGNISKLKDQYSKEKTEFEKVQEMNKQRLDQGLEEKLAARRNRRKRMQDGE